LILEKLIAHLKNLIAKRFTGQIIINMSQGGITKIYKHEELKITKQ